MTDRTWRCSTCANEHDETMPHDTDRASTERLLAADPTEEWVADAWAQATPHPHPDRASAEDINELHSLIAARLTYRASAEGLRELRDELVDEQGDNYPLYDWVIRFEEAVRADERALRDTGPRPDSGIDDLRALFAEPHHLGFALSGRTGMYDTESVLIKRDWYERLRACLSTPRTETSE